MRQTVLRNAGRTPRHRPADTGSGKAADTAAGDTAGRNRRSAGAWDSPFQHHSSKASANFANFLSVSDKADSPKIADNSFACLPCA